MVRSAFILALVLSAFSLPLAVAASLGGSQENVEAIVKHNFAPIDLPLRR
jgi:hypothetical protein